VSAVKEQIVTFYRADPAPRMRKVLVPAATLVTIGGLVMVISFLTRQRDDVRILAACIGVVCIVTGSGSAVIGLRRLLADDWCIVVRTDGLMAQLGREETFVPWGDIERIWFDAGPRAIVVDRRTGGDFRVPEQRYRGTTTEKLAKELDGMRLKASFSMLRA
jgi:hypothetical protein